MEKAHGPNNIGPAASQNTHDHPFLFLADSLAPNPSRSCPARLRLVVAGGRRNPSRRPASRRTPKPPSASPLPLPPSRGQWGISWRRRRGRESRGAPAPPGVSWMPPPLGAAVEEGRRRHRLTLSSRARSRPVSALARARRPKSPMSSNGQEKIGDKR